MKKILTILIMIFIALAGVACVSASSDFDLTVYNENIVSDINDSVVPMDESEDCIDDSVVPIDNIEVNDTEDYSNSTEIDNSTEPVDGDSEIVIDNSTDENLIQGDKPILGKWECRDEYKVVAPEVDVIPTIVDSGDKILDDAYYYSAYYNAYKEAFAFDLLDPLNLMRSLDAVFDLIFQTHGEHESVLILTKLYCIAELKYNYNDPFVKDIVESSVYSVMDERFRMRYFDPNEEYHYEPPHHDSDPHHPIF